MLKHKYKIFYMKNIDFFKKYFIFIKKVIKKFGFYKNFI